MGKYCPIGFYYNMSIEMHRYQSTKVGLKTYGSQLATEG